LVKPEKPIRLNLSLIWLKRPLKLTICQRYLENTMFRLMSSRFGLSVFNEQGFHVFETSPDQQNKQLKNKIANLEQMVGKKEVELNLLKIFQISIYPQIPNS